MNKWLKKNKSLLLRLGIGGVLFSQLHRSICNARRI